MSNYITDLRKERGMSQRELADLMGVHQTSVSHWELGENSLRGGNLMRLAKIFGMTYDQICEVLEETAPIDRRRKTS